MTDFDILGFDPTQLDIYNKEEHRINFGRNENIGINIERNLNYPIKNYYDEKSEEINNAETVVIYCYKELIRQSFDAINWLRSSQFKPKSEKEDTAHRNKKNQIISTQFQILFCSKFNNIVELAKRISKKLDTYSWEYNYYKFIMEKFIKYIVGNNKDSILYEQTKTLVDGIMKITLSARWDYDTKSFILENKPYSNKYILGNGKWTKMIS